MLWRPCLVCGVDTTNYCKICARTSSDGTTTGARFYCDADCRKKDETEHLKVHMTMKRSLPFYMERAVKAGQIVQSLFYAFRENTWTYDMKEVGIMRDQESDLVAVEVIDGAGVVTAPGGYTDCKSYAGGWLIEFPLKAFAEYGDDAKRALLTDRSSTWALVVMHTAVKALFQELVDDIQIDVEEVVHYPTEKASRIVHASGHFRRETRRQDILYPDEDEQGDTKSVYRITLKCGSKIALDLAGAQWDIQDGKGLHKPVTYWEDYRSRWITSIKYSVPFRSHAIRHAKKMSDYHMVTAQTLITEITFYFNIFITRACEAEIGFRPHQLLDMDSESYHVSLRRFIDKAVEYLQKRQRDLDNGSPHNIFNTFDMRHPKVIAEASKARPTSNGSLPLDIGDMQEFDWNMFSRLVQQPGSEVSLQEKKVAKRLQWNRSVYKEPGTWQLVFLEDTLPGPRIDEGCVSENPRWRLG